jgi:hypothetical protein
MPFLVMRHHYVPCFYLSAWTTSDGKLVEFKRREDGIVRARRTATTGTGYEHDLYRIDGLPPALAHSIEMRFMAPLDGRAAIVQRTFLSRAANVTFDIDERSAWTRFLLSLRYRNPEAVEIIKSQLAAIWDAAVAALRSPGEYDRVRRPSDPPTVEAYLVRTDANVAAVAAMNFLQEIIDSRPVGSTINGMRWQAFNFPSTTTLTLLTSDRPLDFGPGLGSPNAFISLPIGPRSLFLATRDGRLPEAILQRKPVEVIAMINKGTVARARRFVWSDGGQIDLVRKLISTAPDPPLLSEEQKQEGINAARNRESL